MPCSICQSEQPEGANYCPVCGAAQSGPATGPTQRLRPAALTRQSLRSGICPLCSAASVFTNQKLPKKWWHNHEPASIAVGNTFNAQITHYICGTCGYIEGFVEDSLDRSDIREEWILVDPASTTLQEAEG